MPRTLIAMAVLLLLAPIVGCTPYIEREVLFKPLYVPRSGTLWLVEKDAKSSEDDQVRIVICHREAAPPCIRLVPQDTREGYAADEYRRWLDSMPPEIRRLAMQADDQPVVEVPKEADESR